MSYWEERGKYQDLYKEHKGLQKSKTPCGKLLRIVINIYFDFHNNGNDNWYYLIKNTGIDTRYKPPSDAPSIVKSFFKNMKTEYEQQSEIRDDEDRVPDFGPEELEELVDSVLLYVDKKTKPKIKKTIEKIKTKPVIDPQSCKILNPDTGKYVDLHGPTILKVLQKYAPGLFGKSK